jgi:phytoene/squalene synthetase
VLVYCRFSANPVGRLLLHLYGVADEPNQRDADAICTALQLINFLQDLEQDYVENNRIYIPHQAMQRHGVDESWFARRRCDAAMRALIDEQIDQARTLLLLGAPLAWRLSGRFGLEIRLTVAGGLRILQRLAQAREDVFTRPRLQWTDKLWMIKRALLTRPLPQDHH